MLRTLRGGLANLTFLGSLFVVLFKIDNIGRGNRKPHFFDGAYFSRLFKRDNITRGSWNPHLFDKLDLSNFSSLTKSPEGFGNQPSLKKIFCRIVQTLKPHLFDQTQFILLFMIDNIM